MANAISGSFDLLGSAAIALLVFGLVLGFAAIVNADFDDTITTDYGNTSTAALVLDETNQGFLDMSGYTGIIVTAIVFVIILAIVMLIVRQKNAME